MIQLQAGDLRMHSPVHPMHQLNPFNHCLQLGGKAGSSCPAGLSLSHCDGRHSVCKACNRQLQAASLRR